MKNQVLVDTDVVLDLLMERHPFHLAAAELFSLAEKKEVKLCVSALTMPNLFYILSKNLGASQARQVLARFQVLVRILPVDADTISLALSSSFRDFEDAVQYYCALSSGIGGIITRNVKDYKSAEIPVMTAREFLDQS